ncbi:oxaloacetate decarboxylase [Spirochaetota bacterium]
MKKTTRLRQLIEDKKILAMPGAYDAISAKIIEKAGFDALQVTGFGLAAALQGKPDIGIISMGDMLYATRNIAQSVNIPVMADGDTGFGNEINVYHTVKSFEEAGAAGINLEDQVFPKRCGHMEGKQVVTMEEMARKIKAAVMGRKDPDFIINARTDAIAVYGIEDAIKRGNAYAEAGADLIFVEAPNTKEEIKYVIDKIKAPVSINMAQGGKTPVCTVDELEKLGAARVSYPITALFAAARAMEKALQVLKKNSSTEEINDAFMSFEEFTDLVGLPDIKKIEDEINSV